VIVSRLRRTAFAIGTAACMAAAFATAMTTPASAHTTASAAPSAIAAPAELSGRNCGDGDGFTGAPEFWRCTGNSATSLWVGSSCKQNEYNAGSKYNVYAVWNYCSTRVWLHADKYPADETGGWTFCVPPFGFPDASEDIPSTDVHPANIEVTANVNNC
jgi:hypothetical protein